jgi:UDP-N-acetyl-D-glucosamine dehydrogenase
LNDAKKSVKGAKIFVLGVAYKKDTGDTRESPALDVIRLLQENGAVVTFHDPYSNAIRGEDGRIEKGSPLTQRTLKAADLVVIVTDHAVFDYESIVAGARRVLDTRNATRNVKKGRAKIVKL